MITLELRNLFEEETYFSPDDKEVYGQWANEINIK